MLRKYLNRLYTHLQDVIELVYLPMDKYSIRRTKNIVDIPRRLGRRGGKAAYGEWCHVVGIFQTLLQFHQPQAGDNDVLDVGCGTGLLAIASDRVLGKGGRYLGIDVSSEDIQFCQRHYTADRFQFQHLSIHNQMYAPDQGQDRLRWDVADASFDMVTALSVWTHMNEGDAIFYFGEVDRVLKPGGRALITFFLLDEHYEANLSQIQAGQHQYHRAKRAWVFDQRLTENWYYPKWANVPENAIGVTEQGLAQMLAGTSLHRVQTYPGTWKEQPGMYFQDVLIFEKR